MKKKYLNLFFQIVVLVFIVQIIFFEETDLKKLTFIFSAKIQILLILSLLSKIFLTYLFYLLLKIVCSRNFNFFETSNFFLQGGIVNQLLPGVGFVYKYYKFNTQAGVSVSEFATSQALWSFFIFTAYILLAVLFGYTSVTISKFSLIFLLVFIICITVIFYIFRYNIYDHIKSSLLKINRISNFIGQIKIVKDNMMKYSLSLFYIFIGFIILGLLQCFNFFVGLLIFGSDITFISSNYIYISSTLASFITIVNFFGLFELILHISSSIFNPDLKDIILFAFAFRLINILATLILIITYNTTKVTKMLLQLVL